MRFDVIALLPLLGLSSAQLRPNFTSASSVSIYNPSGFFNTTGPWSLMSKAGDMLYIAGTLQLPHRLARVAPMLTDVPVPLTT